MILSPAYMAAIASSQTMGHELVGIATAFAPSNTTLVCALTLLTGGSANAPSAGDKVLVIAASGSQGDRNLNATGNASYTDYTEIHDVFGDDSADTNLWLGIKTMGTTPDTSVTVNGLTVNSDHGAAIIALVFRRISSTLITATATGANSFHANPPSVTPTVPGSWVLAIGAGMSANANTVEPTISGFTKLAYVRSPGDGGVPSGTLKLLVAYSVWSGSGAVDPPAFTDADANTSSDSWAAISAAVAPE